LWIGNCGVGAEADELNWDTARCGHDAGPPANGQASRCYIPVTEPT